MFLSPLADVEIPDVPLTDYVLARADELGDKPALVDGASGRFTANPPRRVSLRLAADF